MGDDRKLLEEGAKMMHEKYRKLGMWWKPWEQLTDVERERKIAEYKEGLADWQKRHFFD